MGSVLHIIPVVGMMGNEKDGLVLPMGKGRTYRQVNDLIIEQIHAKMQEKSSTRIKRAITLSGYGDKNQDVYAALLEKIKTLPVDEIVEGQGGLVDAVYCGPGAYGVSILL
jgi:fatty acid-binding protein DegV